MQKGLCEFMAASGLIRVLPSTATGSTTHVRGKVQPLYRAHTTTNTGAPVIEMQNH